MTVFDTRHAVKVNKKNKKNTKQVFLLNDAGRHKCSRVNAYPTLARLHWDRFSDRQLGHQKHRVKGGEREQNSAWSALSRVYRLGPGGLDLTPPWQLLEVTPPVLGQLCVSFLAFLSSAAEALCHFQPVGDW